MKMLIHKCYENALDKRTYTLKTRYMSVRMSSVRLNLGSCVATLCTSLFYINETDVCRLSILQNTV